MSTGLDLFTAPPALDSLRTELSRLEAVVVAFSGGVDSAVLAHVALEVLGPDRTLAVTARSASLASGEIDHCRSLAQDWGLPWTTVDTAEMTDARYVANDGDRCRWCKTALMETLRQARALSPAVWIARLDEIARWWKARAEATATISETAAKSTVRSSRSAKKSGRLSSSHVSTRLSAGNLEASRSRSGPAWSSSRVPTRSRSSRALPSRISARSSGRAAVGSSSATPER